MIRQLQHARGQSRPPRRPRRLQEGLIGGGIARFHREFRPGAPVIVDNPLGDLSIETNTEVFEEVLSKVLINAWESYDSPPDQPRPIELHTRRLTQPGAGDYVEIRVEDRGRGIDPELRDQIFEPFISSKHTVGVGAPWG